MLRSSLQSIKPSDACSLTRCWAKKKEIILFFGAKLGVSKYMKHKLLRQKKGNGWVLMQPHFLWNYSFRWMWKFSKVTDLWIIRGFGCPISEKEEKEWLNVKNYSCSEDAVVSTSSVNIHGKLYFKSILNVSLFLLAMHLLGGVLGVSLNCSLCKAVFLCVAAERWPSSCARPE